MTLTKDDMKFQITCDTTQKTALFLQFLHEIEGQVVLPLTFFSEKEV